LIMKKIAAALLTTFTFSVIGVVAANDGSCKTIYDIVCETAGLDQFCGLIQSTNVKDTLADQNNSFTVFAPINDAITSIRSNNGSIDIMNDNDKLHEIVLFHIHDGPLFMNEVECDAGSNLLRMASGKDSRTICDEFVPIWQKGGGNTNDRKPMIVEKDLSACNGVVHIIDTVMLPGSVGNVIINDPQPMNKIEEGASQSSSSKQNTSYYLFTIASVILSVLLSN